MAALRHTARGIVIHQDRLLLMERWRPDKHYFSVPGGGIEPGETPEQTVVRELFEETGCEVAVDRQLYLLRLPDGTEHHIFHCDYISGEPHLPADSPEALLHDSDNRFRPGWLELSTLETAPFLVWEPIRRQLLHDLSHGFPPHVVRLAPSVVP